jgi:DNA-binding beta-propeller fold protein YncE
VFVAMVWLALSAAQAQTANYALGTSALLVGPAAGSNSVVLAVTPATGTWTASANAAWLHLSPANQSGTGSTNVVFSFDANAGATRSGTLTIAGLPLTVSQAGSTYVAISSTTTLVSSGLDYPEGVAVDGAGNAYIADTDHLAIKEWSAANNTVATLVSPVPPSGIMPSAVAVDGAGNVYFSIIEPLKGIMEWTVANSNVTTLVSSGLFFPQGVAVDGAGNVYIADSENNAIKEWTVANSNVTTLVSSGLSYPFGVAVDTAGNVYIADTGNNAIKEWQVANSTVTTLVSSGLTGPQGVAVDGAGNVYIADTGDGMIKEWTAANGNLATLVSSNLSASPPNYPSGPGGIAVDGTGNVYIADTVHSTIKDLPHAFVDPTPKWESLTAGNDALPVMLPATGNLLAQFAPSSDQSWLTITGITNGVVSFSFTATSSNRVAHFLLLGQSIPVAQGPPMFSLGSTARLEGAAPGSDSVVLAVAPNFAAWAATTAATWLHLTPANQSGTGSTNVVFSYDANTGSTRTGILSIAGLTLSVTQAGSTYVVADPVTTLVSSGLQLPRCVAVNGAGNVYTANSTGAIKEWSAANNTVTTLVASGLSLPCGVAADGAGNVYIADTDNSMIKKWTVANSNVTALVSSGLSYPSGVAVDGAGNVYISDTHNNAIKEWAVANSNVTTLVSSGLNQPSGLAVDGEGNIYIADSRNNAIKEWVAENSNVITLVSLGLSSPYGVTVDGAGNVYIADSSDNAIKEWVAANSTLAILVSSGLSGPDGVAVDSAGNVYIADTSDNAIKELPYAFVDPTPKLESLAGDSDALPGVLPAKANLLGPFAPTSNKAWLTISGITNDVLNFACAAAASNRTGNITLLGQTIPVTQGGPSYSIGTTALLQGPNAGSSSIVLAALPYSASWTNTANATWLHLSPANQRGTGSTNVVFSYDANPSATRSGTLTIAGLTLTVTQAGSTYVTAEPLTTLVPSGLSWPYGVAVDSGGNVYINNGSIRRWTVANNTLTTLVSSGLNGAAGLTVDSAGNVYFPSANGAIEEWLLANSNVISLAPGFDPYGVAVDATGNVYGVGTMGGTIQEWTGGSNSVITLVSSGLSGPLGMALDGAGNVYVADTGNRAIREWMVANGNVTTLVSSGLNYPEGAAVDGAGNVYIADSSDNAIEEWTAANGRLTTLISSGLNFPVSVTVDGTGNVYIADNRNNAIKELPHAFVDPTPKLEGLAAGSDALPVVLPATENLLPPFAPNSDQSWLTINGVANGVVSFAFTANTGPARTAHITLLGQVIPITQGIIGSPPTLTGLQMLGSGAFQFAFTNTPSAVFTVVSTTNLSLPLCDWTVVGSPVEIPAGVYQFTSQPTTNVSQIFYGVISP